MKHVNCRFLLITAVILLASGLAAHAQGGNHWTVKWESPKSFIENKGQFFLPGQPRTVATTDVLYAFDDGNDQVLFTKTGLTYSFVEMTKRKKTEEEKAEELRTGMKCKTNRVKVKYDFVRIEWLDANSDVQVVAEEETPDLHSYAVKDKTGAWQNISSIKAFKKLTYKNLYPHIDVEYVFHPEKGIKYTLILHPGADISQVKMQYSDADHLALDPSGNLHIATLFGDVIDHAPVTFYSGNSSNTIASWFVKDGSSVSFGLGEYDHARTVVIDPWTISPAFSNCNKIWECERDAAGNVYLYGGDTPMRVRKYNSAGTLQWTYNTPWDTSGFWVGSFVVDQAGNTYATSGSNGEIVKVNTSGTQQWYNNPNGLFGPLFEYWHLTFNCDETQLVVGGMRAPNPFSIGNYRGAIMNINLANGAVLGFVPVGWVQGINIKEVKTICSSPNGNYYFLTLDSVGCINSSLALQYKANSGYGFSYGTCGYGVTNQGISAIRATGSFIYTQNGSTVHKRSIATGAIVATAAIPGGSTNSSFGNSPNNSGLDLDNCGNVYVGSGNQVVKYDANLVQLSTAATPAAVYDVAVTGAGEVIACGNGFAASLNMSACGVVVVSCSLNPLSATATSTNVSCNGGCNGTATVTASGGTGPYSYSWAPSGGNAATASSLCAGTYTCTITDNVGATTTASVTITQPSALTASATPTNVLCNGQCTGSATASGSGGTGPYSYSWAPSGGNAATASSLCAGTYTVTVTDNNSCTTTQTVTITQPIALSATATPAAILCNGQCTGSATASGSGGTPTYSYSWAPSGGNAATASSLCAGTYTVTVTDNNGCSTTQTASVTQPATAISAGATSTPATCGNTNGSATTTASGGTGSLTYSWAPSGGNAATASNLAAGNYTCTVTDANGCTQTATVNVANTGAPNVTLQAQTNVSCAGGSNGDATVSPSGGTPPYTYAWSPTGGNAATGTGLGAGTYTCTITDDAGCTTTQTVTITEPAALSASATSTPTGCSTSTGTASVTESGGTGPYTYNWAPSGGTASTANNLAAGSYTCTVTDANGCTTTGTTTVASTGGPTVSLQSSVDVACFGDTTGSATVNATGNGPFTYSWSPSGGSSATATAMPAGTYTVTVTDINNCPTLQTVTITEPPQLTVSATSVPATCGNNNGSATATPAGGTGAYTYAWSNSQSTSTISGLAGGTYSVTVTDANGCTTTTTAVVGNTGAPVVTLQSSADVTCFGGANGTATVNASSGSPPYTYAWSPTGGNAATATGLTAGTYTVTVTGSDGCSQTQTLTITQPASALSGTSAATNENCGDGSGSIALSVSGGTPGYTYAWSNGATTATISNLSAGTYSVTVTDANGCTQVITGIVGNTGSATANAGVDVTILQGQTTLLTGTGGGTYAWSPSTDLSCATCPDPIASPTVTTTYILTVTDTNGCTDTDTITVFVDITCGELYLPNAFSPNADGRNDVLYVRGNCIKVLQFDVYNRWGERVFSTTDPALGWDGTWRGDACETAVFTYVLRATLLDGTEIDKQGNISLVK